MRAVKANRQYTITELEAKRFQAMGYDILDDDGKVMQHGAGKSVPYGKYQEALGRIEAQEAEIAALTERIKTTEAAKKSPANKG
ncbi:hypothetical protein [Ligaoa zhengdingensis]|uniref:hypothetical protein n=1 Tax=Ligaoa zhengdingensis TaxID=2763658 RepID=UPI0031BA8082